MSGKGKPYENAHAESFMKILRSEQVSWESTVSWKTLLETIPIFIEDVYHKKPFHSVPGYPPSCEFEAMVIVTQDSCESAPNSPP